METVLVTGATGFIGSHLVESLLKQNYKVYCLVRNKSILKWLKKVPVEIVEGDCESPSLKLPHVDFVFHLAGRIKAKEPVSFYKTNLYGTINLLRIISKQRPFVKKFVFVSTLAVHGKDDTKIIRPEHSPYPRSHYAKSKWLAEQAVLAYKGTFPVVIFRPTAIYGPRDKEFLSYIKCIKHGIAPVLNSKGILSFCYISDLVNFLIASIQKEIPSGKAFLVSDGQAYTWKQAILNIAEALGKHPLILNIPKPLTMTMAFGFQNISHLLNQPFIFSCDKLKEVFQKSWFCDISQSCNFLDYVPQYDFKKGIKRTIHWYQKQGWL